MGKKSLVVVAASMLVAMLAACGGGGGDSAPPLQDPAFLNLAGTYWAVTDTVSSSNNTCGVLAGTQDIWTAVVATQSGNSLTIYDTRAGATETVAATISGYVVTFNGTRYPVAGCSDMVASYNVTLNSGGTAFSGTATITCLDDGCTVPVSVSGSKN